MSPAMIDKDAAPRLLRWRPFFLLTLFFCSALVLGGCSGKEEASPVPVKAKSGDGAAVKAHKIPTDAAHLDVGFQHFNKGLKLALQGKYDMALKEYEQALKVHPKSAETYNNIGFAYYDKKDYDEAISNQEKALELNPDIANAFFGLALAYEKKGDKEKALVNWKEFTKRADPKSKWHKNAMRHIKDLTMNKKQMTH